MFDIIIPARFGSTPVARQGVANDRREAHGGLGVGAGNAGWGAAGRDRHR